MWYARPELPRTSAWRLTLAFTLIVLLVNTSVLAMVYRLTVVERGQQLEQSVLLAAQTYQQLAGSEAVDAGDLQVLIASRARRSANMILALESGNSTVGNLSQLPPNLPAYPNTARFPVAVANLQGKTSVDMAIGTVLTLQDARLMVGLFDDNQSQHRQDFILASAVALIASVLITLIVGFLFNRKITSRIRELSGQLARIKDGEQLSRLPVREHADEYDAISAQVNSMLDEIDELLQSVASVTDNIAHDLRTPLARIRFRLEDAASSQGNTQPWLHEVIAELDEVLATFESMLELSRLEKGIRETALADCDLQVIARDVVELLAPVAEAEGQTLTLFEEAPAPIRGDSSLLFRAIYNLVENAIKHAGAGAAIIVEQSAVQIRVRDNGPGIPEADRERVFRRLYRLDQSRHTKGTGLGLSIVRAVARLHGADIVLGDAAPGLLATMTFTAHSTPESPAL